MVIINKNGKINLGEFMYFCQYGNNGYYIKNKPIGKNNDFITAPEISQMFGEILGSFIINYWEKKIGDEFNLVELGPGKGTLIKDFFYYIKTCIKSKDFELYLLIPIILMIFIEIWPVKSTGSFFTTANATYFWLLIAIFISKKKI